MSTTAKQDRDFVESLIDSRLLENAIEWIKSNLEPQDVFSTMQLNSWAFDNGFVESPE